MLPQQPVSAVDCVGPAIEWTKRAMLRPFSWAKWWRVGLLGAAVGELSSFSCNFNGGNWSEITRKHPQQFQAAAANPLPFPPEVLTSIVGTLIIGITLLVLVHLYVASVLRFVYFDSVATGRFHLREGWARWHSRGVRWFLFSLLVMLVVLGAMAVILVPAILLGVAAHKAMGAGGVALLALIGVPIALVLLIVAACLGVLVKDFAIPMMALESMTPFAAFKRVIAIAWSRKGEHAGYLGMKIVLAIGFGIAVAIVQTILLVLMLIPIIGAIVAGGVLGAGHGTFDPQQILNNPALLALMVLAFVLLIILVMIITAVILAPGLFFFEAYVLTWYAQRYEPLWNLLYPAPPPPPAPVEPIVAPEPPPLPAV
jgi:hypothetical protein